MKSLSDNVILTIQITGFITALAILPFVHGWQQAVFAVGFTIHFVGDILRLHKDGLI